MLRFNIQRLKKEDHKRALNLLKQLWPEKRLKTSMLSRGKALVVKKGKRVVGLSLLKVQFNMMGRLQALVVDRKFRRKGVGKKLLRKTVQTAKNHSCKFVFLLSNYKRTTAHRFYKSNNFKKLGCLFYLKL
ncbi:GNAT family N-acetyltransferase [Nanoarchaeota archaeon]